MQRGFTYLGLLAAIAIIGIGLVAASEVWTTAARRHRMQELEWVGQQYEQAIGSYYEASPNGAKRYPPSLDDLLQDPRYAAVRRHLRRLYPDPMTGQFDWKLMRAPDGGVQAVQVEVPGLDGQPGFVREFGYLPGTIR
jgi:type II secretory pathway pseudopilin PulG